jgi:hypothetical protein
LISAAVVATDGAFLIYVAGVAVMIRSGILLSAGNADMFWYMDADFSSAMAIRQLSIYI